MSESRPQQSTVNSQHSIHTYIQIRGQIWLISKSVVLNQCCSLVIHTSLDDFTSYINGKTSFFVVRRHSSSRLKIVGIWPRLTKSILFNLTQHRIFSGSSSGFCACLFFFQGRLKSNVHICSYIWWFMQWI